MEHKRRKLAPGLAQTFVSSSGNLEPSSPPSPSNSSCARPLSPISALSESFRSHLNMNELRVESGIKYFNFERRAFVFGSNSLDWLLSFSPRDWSVIYVARVPSLDIFATKVHRRMNVITSELHDWVAHSRSCDVLLGAGSASGMSKILAELAKDIPTIMFAPGSSARDRRGISSRVLHHHSVGGATSCSGRLWRLNWNYTDLPQAVSRQLGHLLDHSTLPTACSREPSFAHLSPEDLLPMTKPLLPVVFPTHATRTNWGSRELTAKEVALCLDAPLWIVSNPVLLSLFVQRYDQGQAIPLKLLQTPLQDCLASIDPSVPIIEPPGPVSSQLFQEDRRGSWLPLLGKWLPSTWVDAASTTAKAAKNDDAEIYTGLWDSRITSVLLSSEVFLRQLRCALFGWWAGRVYRSFRAYLVRKHGSDWSARLTVARQQAASQRAGTKFQQQGGGKDRKINNNKGGVGKQPDGALGELLRDAEAGQRALRQVLSSDWWEWSMGSSLLFWRWDQDSQFLAARDGMEIFVQGTLPTQMRPARRPTPEKAAQLGPKIDKVRLRNYIVGGRVSNLTDFFDVPKGDEDIRVVYNGTSSGLNEALWAPGFFLPNADSAARLLMFYSFTVDADLGEMFLNFPMDPAIQPFAGVDLSGVRDHLTEPASKGTPMLERWERLFMGMRSSPYNSVRYFYWAEEFGRGNPLDEGNALRYDRVILNLPGMPDFDPSKPNVMKWNDIVDRLAGDIVTFVDDLRASGYDRENAWQVARQITSRLQYLGIQDAPRKRRPSSQSGGAWAGTIFEITADAIFKTVSKEKWEKGRTIIQYLVERCKGSDVPSTLNHRDLTSKRGFLVHLSMTFTNLVPFLKGLHLTIDSWRPLRKDDGWKFSLKESRAWLAHQVGDGVTEDEVYDMLNVGAPAEVEPVPRLIEDLEFLAHFFAQESPPRVMVRSRLVFLIVYGFGDASGKGFGSTFTVQNGISYRIGVWNPDESDESSNWREFTNVVEALEEEAASGRLKNCTIYFFTDNTTVEAALYKGTSTSKKLLALVIRVKLLETQQGIRIFVSHVSGNRMIAEGGDGVSRGSLNEGVMAGEDILSFIPLHLSAIERSSALLPWLRSWTGSDLEVLTPTDWFQKGHDIRGWKKAEGEPFQRPVIKAGVYGWFPPPAAADVALEQLRIARTKRQDSTHLFVCPRLFCPMWLKQMNKACDLVFKIPVGAIGWPVEMFEPLLIGVCFPFLRFKPWQFRKSPKISWVARKMHELRDNVEVDRGPFLRKFWLLAHRLLSMPERMVSRVLFFEQGDPVPCGSDGQPVRKKSRGRRRSVDHHMGQKSPKKQKQVSSCSEG